MRLCCMQAVVGGGMPQRPAFGALLFADIERGEELYGTSGTESGLVGQYLPVPVSGMFASGEQDWANREGYKCSLSRTRGA